MRIAELEDKLAKVHISEDEMKAYQKVSSLLGANPAGGCVAECVTGCIAECVIRQCTIVRQCTIIRQCTVIRQCTIIRQCTWECFECGGGCAPGGGLAGGGGFGMLGG
jgi:hypothetical protein